MKIVLMLLLVIVKADHDFFEYSDCGSTCTNQRVNCVISEDEAENFEVKCCSSEDCEALASNTVVCLQPGKAPLGGSDIWPDFQRSVHPSTTTVTPEVQSECTVWKTLLGIGWSLNGVIILFCVVKLALRKLRGRSQPETSVEDAISNQPSEIDVLVNDD